MESKIQSSFIPKQPVAQSARTANARYKSGGVDVMMLAAIVSLVIAGVLSAGVFFYKQSVDTSITATRAQLEKARSAFSPELITELMRLSDRIRIAEGILANHTAPSVFLGALERDTLTSVQFTELTYEQKSNDLATIALTGKTNSVNSVALQSSRFGENGSVLRNTIFSDIDLVKGGVVFTVDSEVDLAAIRFASAVATPQQASFDLESAASEEFFVDDGAGDGGFGTADTNENEGF